MRLRNFLPLMSLFIMDYSVFINSVLSQTLATEGLHWGTMGTYTKVNGHVYHLEEDESKPGNILFSSDHTLMTTDGMTTHLVVGSGTFGYAEGRSAQAEFMYITGFLQTSSSQVLLVDRYNHCLRYVNRITNLTSPFVGNCTSRGLSDGLYRNARFDNPWSVVRSLVNPKTAIVTDYSNRAIRSIDLTKGDVKTLIKGLPGNPVGAAFDSDLESIFITFHTFLGKLNLKTLVFTQLTPAANTGGLDGEFSKASFGFAQGILCMNKVCLIADYWSYRLRVADVAKQTIHSICTGDDSSVDGTTTDCSLRYPHSLYLKSDTLYIGEYEAIRKISVRRHFACEDISLKLAAGEQRKCVEVVPGHNICLTPGISMYSILEKKCTIEINVTKDLGVCQNNPCLNSGMCTAGENNTYMCDCKDGWTGSSCQTEYNTCTFNPCRNFGRCSANNNTFTCSYMPGWTGIICEKELDVCQNNPCLNSGICTAGDNKTYTCVCRAGWTGRNCQAEINACIFNPCKNSGRCLPKDNTFTCSCMPGWTGIICEKELDVCQNNPCLNYGICTAGDNKTYTCVCRAGWTGMNCQTEINACMFNPCKNSGRCLPTNNTFTCSCNAGWTGSLCDAADKNGECPDEIFGVGDPKKKAAKIKFPDGDLMILPLGRYIYRKQLPDNTTCEIMVHVSDPRLMMRLDFSAKYKLTCSLLQDFRQLLLSFARTRYSQLGQLSSGSCNKSADHDVYISCDADVVQVVWPTDCLFGSGSTKERQRILAVVDGYLDKHKVFVLDLFIPYQEPPIIQPFLNKDGRPASVIWTPICSGGLKYMNSTETCQ